MRDPLHKIFGTAARVKILRLFLLNPKESFTLADAASRARLLPQVARREIALSVSAGLVRRLRMRRGTRTRFALDDRFSYRAAFQNLFLNSPVRSEEVRKRLYHVGSVKLIVIAGLLVGDFDGRIDILLVADKVNGSRLSKAIRTLEADLGKEIRYAILGAKDFRYRLGLYDRLIRDVLDYEHKIVFDRLHIPLPS